MAREYYEVALDLKERAPQRAKFYSFERDPNAAQEARVRYGMVPDGLGGGDAIDDLPRLLAMGRDMLRVDESLMSTVHYYKGTQCIEFNGFFLNDHTGVITQMNQIADRVAEIEADSISISAEVWTATYDHDQIGVRATDREDRQEGLSLVAVRSDGTARSVLLPFVRTADGKKQFLPARGNSPMLYMFEPIRKAWNLRRWWPLAPSEAVRGC